MTLLTPIRGASRRRVRGAWAAVTVVALAATLSVVGTVSPASAAEADTLHSLVNQARAANGLGALSRNGAMDAVAVNWANQLAANGSLSHNPSYSSQIPGGWSAAAENVAQGHPDANSMHDGWMASSGHRANILGNHTAVGIAFVAAGGTTWGVQVFARYGADVPPPAPVSAPAPAPAAPAPSPPVSVPAPATVPTAAAVPEADPNTGSGFPSTSKAASDARGSRSPLSDADSDSDSDSNSNSGSPDEAGDTRERDAQSPTTISDSAAPLAISDSAAPLAIIVLIAGGAAGAVVAFRRQLHAAFKRHFRPGSR
jgi:hypothetical protein